MASENDGDDIEIISTQDEKIKLIGEIFSNDSCRKIQRLISDDNEMTANEIAQKNDMSLTLTIHHLKRMQTAGMIKITKTGISAKGQEMKYYCATNQSFLITPEKSTQSIITSLKKFSKFAVIGLAGFVSWATLRNDGGSYDMLQTDGTEQTNLVIDSGTTVTSDSDTNVIDTGSDTWSSSEEANLKESSVLEPVPEPESVFEPEPSHSGIENFDFSDSNAVATGSVELDRTVYPHPFVLTSAESAEPLIFSIIIPIIVPIGVIVGGIILERVLSRWWNKRKQKIKEVD